MNLNTLVLKVGLSGQSELEIATGKITVFVGPNNSGKSLILREIESYLKNDEHRVFKLLQSIDIALDVEDDETRILVEERKTPFNSTGFPQGSFFLGRKNLFNNSDENALLIPAGDYKSVLVHHDNKRKLAYLFTIRLDGSTRLNFLNKSDSEDLSNRVRSVNARLLKQSDKREEVRSMLAGALGKYLYFDTSAMVYTRAKFSDSPINIDVETSFNDFARKFHESTVLYEDLGDGFKAYSGIIAAAIGYDAKILLIDEPEAFLHPPLASRLGGDLVGIISKENKQLFVSTHNPFFLFGVLQSGVNVDIVRLTYNDGEAKAKTLINSEIRLLTSNPAMRSANVLNALFHKGALITEADSDRVLYEEISYRLNKHEGAGIKDSIILNVNGKSSIAAVMRPLRKCGIPVAACVDFDFFFENSDFGSVTEAANIPYAVLQSIKSQRQAIFTSVMSDKSIIKENGIRYFGENNHEIRDLIERLEKYGIFVIPNGEVESWLPEVKVEGSKVRRMINLMNAIGSEPQDANYLTPTAGDVWNYIRKIGRWIADANRLGMN